MPPEESLYPADWLRIAEKDFGRVEQLLSIQDSEAERSEQRLPDYDMLLHL